MSLRDILIDIEVEALWAIRQPWLGLELGCWLLNNSKQELRWRLEQELAWMWLDAGWADVGA